MAPFRRYLTMALPPDRLPTFLIIGAQKSATRWLRYNLGLHPDIYTVDDEVWFFNIRRNFSQGLSWYRGQFTGWAGQPIVGEATPGYMMWRHDPRRVARRIHETVPEVRLIAILRDPVERAHSAMLHHIRRGRLTTDTSLLEYVRRIPPEQDRLNLVAGGWYAASLHPFKRLFGDRLKVFLHDDVCRDPVGVYVAALRHLGVRDDYVPQSVGDVLFSHEQKYQGHLDAQAASLTPEARAELFEYFRADVRELQRMLGRDLSMWIPEGRVIDESQGGFRRRHTEVSLWLDRLVGSLSARDLELPTPCRAWNVADLLDHLVERTKSTVSLLGGGRTEGGAPERSAIDRYRDMAARLTALIDAPDVGRDAEGAPKHLIAAEALVEQVVHGWDLATATGRPVTLSDDVVAFVEALVRAIFGTSQRARDRFDDEFEVGPGRSPVERLVAYLGRDPDWGRSVRGAPDQAVSDGSG
ncbi:MAG TPA: TIGR03086 family metal-binding protein [Vicinamibacterales bacterium]|nr:TIGR03086 family metal-binding protein [Vicinamibacterales bacterium]